MHIIKLLAVNLLCLCLAHNGISQTAAGDLIRINQNGFYASGPKAAVVINTTATDFSLINTATKEKVFTAPLKASAVWEYSNEKASKADFSKFNKPGTYVVSVNGVGESYPFIIGSQVNLPLGKAALKMYYYQRASTELTEKYAGKWARKAGHPDNEVLVHASAATSTRPAGTKISSPRGWYDAGDYNKYIVNSGISTYTLLSLYEHYPKFCDTLNTFIPESGNNLPDLLDEVLWNLRWMLTMQDQDGGVYHKLTNPNFDGSVMPHAATEARYVVKKSTAASLDFAAVTAQAYRIFRNFNKQLPGFADSCLIASKSSYTWSKKNPGITYVQSLMNASYNPDIVTGEYGDQGLDDEFQWAAMELYISTGKFNYYDEANLKFTMNNFDLPNWAKVNTLGLYSFIKFRSELASVEEMELLKDKLIKMADSFRKNVGNSAFGVPMGLKSTDFNWGSNANAANQGVLLIQAYNLTGDKSYLDAAVASLDYLLGRNGTGYSFFTGYGEKSTKNPHSRPSESDGIEDPVPGLLAGGPNPGMEDASNCGGKYVGKLPATAYIDDKCSYASNEIAINWNAPFAYLTLAIEAIKGPEKK